MKPNSPQIVIAVKTFGDSVRCLFCQLYSPGELNPDKPEERTLLIRNVPPLVEEAGLREMFRKFGSLSNVIIQHKQSDRTIEYPALFSRRKMDIEEYRVAYVVFEKEEDLKKLLSNPPKNATKLRVAKKQGVKLWCKEYNDSFLDAKVLIPQINAELEAFDRAEKEKKASSATTEEQDDDGWTVVTKANSKRVIVDANQADKKLLRKNKKKDDKRQRLIENVGDLYSIKKVEKSNRLDELKQKFENDKKRVNELKKNRKFKPY